MPLGLMEFPHGIKWCLRRGPGKTGIKQGFRRLEDWLYRAPWSSWRELFEFRAAELASGF